MIRLDPLIDWLDERLPIRGVLSTLAQNLRKPIPRHANVFYTLGSLALFLFILQALTGLLMMK